MIACRGRKKGEGEFMKKLLLTLTILCLMAAPSWAALSNGNFESGTFDNSNPFNTLPPPGTITGWTVGGDSIDWIGTYWQAPAGTTRSIDLAGNNAGSISTTFDTVMNQKYTVSFYLSGNYDGDTGDPLRRAYVSINGGAPQLFTFANFDGWSHSNMGWTLQTLSFMADSAKTMLTFSSGQGDSPYGAAIGNVNVVPIPASVWLLASGLIGFVGIRRRFK
jgi:choice-of-anchor C domain-containing protein